MRKRNICRQCLKEKKVLSFIHTFEPVIATCFYCRKVNQDSLYIMEENERAKKTSQEKSTQSQQA